MQTQEHVNELYHYGIKGMKWGVRRDRIDGTSSVSAKKKKKKIIARELDKNASIMRNYVKVIKTHGQNSPQEVVARKRVNDQEKHLRKLAIDYLKSLSKQEVDNLVKFDVEHGRRYVESKVFDKRWNDLDDGIYID